MPEAFDCYVLDSAYRAALEHARTAAASRLESMGLLAGSVHRAGSQTFVLVTDYLTAENASTAVSVRFSPAAFEELMSQYSPRLSDGQLIVGWLHSHPSYGCFLSVTDVKTQQAYFSESFNVAFVVDPQQVDGKGLPAFRAYRLNPGAQAGYSEISYAVIRPVRREE